MSSSYTQRRGASAGREDRERNDAAYGYMLQRRAKACRAFLEAGGLERWHKVRAEVTRWAEALPTCYVLGADLPDRKPTRHMLCGGAEELSWARSAFAAAGYGDAPRADVAAFSASQCGLTPEDVVAFCAGGGA